MLKFWFPFRYLAPELEVGRESCAGIWIAGLDMSFVEIRATLDSLESFAFLTSSLLSSHSPTRVFVLYLRLVVVTCDGLWVMSIRLKKMHC